MLKFVEKLDSDKKNEGLIKEELEIKSSLEDFLSQSSSLEIKNKILTTLQDIKQKNRKDEMFYTKLLYYFSLVIKEKGFILKEKTKKCIDNIISVCESENDRYLKVFEDLYSFFNNDEEFEGKQYIIEKILGSKLDYVFSEKYSYEQQTIKFISVLENFINLTINIKKKRFSDIDEIIEKFAKKINEKKIYHLLTKLNESEALLQILKANIESVHKSVPKSQLYFFLNMSSKDLVDISLEDNLKLNSALTSEIQLLKEMYDRKDDKILFEYKTNQGGIFEKDYGSKGEEIILMGAKECSIQQIFNSCNDDNQNIISFKEIIEQIYEEDEEDNNAEKQKKEIKDEEVQGLFEEIEDVIISGSQKNLYNVFIDYEKKEIKILYVRRQVYEEANRKNLLKNVKATKAKLEMILKAIDNL